MADKKEFIEVRKEALLVTPTLQAKAQALTIKTDADYQAASQVLANIKAALIGPFMQRVDKIIAPLAEALDEARGLKRDVKKPLEEAEEIVKLKMKQYQLEKAEIERKAQQAREDEERKLAAEAQQKELALANARTKAMRDKLATANAELAQKRAELAAQQPAPAVKAVGSQTRKTKKWRVVSLTQFILSLVWQSPINPKPNVILCMKPEAEDLMSLISIDSVQMNCKFRLDNPKPGEWMPGIECYEDIDIAGSRR